MKTKPRVKKAVDKNKNPYKSEVEKKKTGRPKKPVPDFTDNTMLELAGNLSDQEIADYLGMDRGIFKKRLAENKNLNQQYKRGVASKKYKAVNKLWEHIDNGNIACLLFYIKCRMGWKENAQIEHSIDNRTIKVEFFGSDGNKIKEVGESRSEESKV